MCVCGADTPDLNMCVYSSVHTHTTDVSFFKKKSRQGCLHILLLSRERTGSRNNNACCCRGGGKTQIPVGKYMYVSNVVIIIKVHHQWISFPQFLHHVLCRPPPPPPFSSASSCHSGFRIWQRSSSFVRLAQKKNTPPTSLVVL